MRYAVTGGAGFIGSHLVERLLRDGHDVVVVDDFSTGRRQNLAPILEHVELVEGSITDPSVCAKALHGADFVLHQAAIPSVPRSVADPARTNEANVTGTLNVLIAARDAGVRRVVYAGSSSAYGDTPELPKHEGMPSFPLSPYAVSKLAGEQYVRAFFRTYGLETIGLRYFNIFGPRQDPASQYAAVVPRFITAAMKGQSPVIYGDGTQSRDFTYVENAVHANLLACAAPARAAGQVFNVACGERMSVNELWQRIAALVGSDVEPRYEPTRAGEVRDSLASLARACEVLGYEPQVSVDEGLRRCVDALRIR